MQSGEKSFSFLLRAFFRGRIPFRLSIGYNLFKGNVSKIRNPYDLTGSRYDSLCLINLLNSVFSGRWLLGQPWRPPILFPSTTNGPYSWHLITLPRHPKNWLQLQANPEENNNSNPWSFVQSEQQKRPQVYSHLAVRRKLVKEFKEGETYHLARRCQQFPLQTPFKLHYPIEAKAATANSHTQQGLHISNCVLQTLRNSWRVSKIVWKWYPDAEREEVQFVETKIEIFVQHQRPCPSSSNDKNWLHHSTKILKSQETRRKREKNVSRTVLAHAEEPEKLITKKRSKSCENKPSLKQRINQNEQNWR